MTQDNSHSTTSEVTILLRAMRAGNTGAAEQLIPIIYSELHRLAKAYMRRERDDHTLQPTALVNEAYMRLASDDVEWQNREHFIGVAANVMRHVLVDHARQRKAQFRGGKMKRVELKDDLAIELDRLDEIIVLDEALDRLAQEKPRQARIVELKYFTGLSIEEIGSLLGIAPRSVKRDWALAKIWLFEKLQKRGVLADRD